MEKNGLFNKSKIAVVIITAMLGLSACTDSTEDNGNAAADNNPSDSRNPGTPRDPIVPTTPTTPITPTTPDNSDVAAKPVLDLDAPAKIKMGIWNNTELVVGQSRSIEAMLIPDESLPYPGSPEEVLHKQGITWSSSNEAVATVDKFGRVKAVSTGAVEISARSVTNTTVVGVAKLNVVATPTLNKQNPTVMIKGDKPAKNPILLEKQVTRYASTNVSQDLVDIRAQMAADGGDEVLQDNIRWLIQENTNPGREGVYIVREDRTATNRDRMMYFMGNRYLPIEANIAMTGEVEVNAPVNYVPQVPTQIMSDGNKGIWITSASGALSHIAMVRMNPDAKASLMSDVTQRVVDRRGSVSDASYRADGSTGTWHPEITDNDGLWTSMYGGGELMRYATLKREGADQEEIEAARKTALRALKFDLLLSNISGRKGEVKTKVRPIVGADGGDYKLQTLVLRKDGEYAINNKPTGPTGNGGKVGLVYNMKPIDDTQFVDDPYAIGALNDTNADYDTKTRTIEGFFARTYAFQGADTNGFTEGYVQGGANNYFPGGHTVARAGELGTKGDLTGKKIAKFVYCDGVPRDLGGNKDCNPVGEKMAGLEINAELPIPDVLQCTGAFAAQSDCANAMEDDLGNIFTEEQVLYKADTSNDESIGHFFIYRIAYDILDESNPEEKATKDLIRTTMQKWADQLIANEYNFVDASGQPTKWGKTSRDYFNNDYAWEDAALNSVVLVAGMKVAAYVTGEQRYESEYQALASKQGYDYATLAKEYWSRWAAFAGAQYGADTSIIGCLDSTPVVETGDNTKNSPSIGTFASGNDGGGMCGDGIEDPNDPVQVEEWVREVVNTSDEEMAALAWYILFTTEQQGTELHQQYVEAYDEWYRSMGYQENPFFDYVRQLGQPQTELTNASGNNLKKTAAWQLHRHPIDTRRWGAYDFARPDVWKAGIGSEAATREDRYPIIRTNDSAIVDSRTMRDQVLAEGSHTTLPLDERMLTKFNNSTFNLGFKPLQYHQWLDKNTACFDNDASTACVYTGTKPNPAYGSPTTFEGSTTYTLPYWMGRFHSFLAKPE
ncbi:Ig-like domain-containing protein [Aeromonas aquatica]